MTPHTTASDRSLTGYASARPAQALEPASASLGIAAGQAGICARVAEAARQALPLLDELTPLGAEPDLPAIQEHKGWIRSEFMELIGELTFDDGPDVARVEEVFSLLLDQMGTLQDLMEDEEGVTGFPDLADRIAALYRSWNNMQQLFETQIGIVKKQLSLVVEAVANVRNAMDSVFMGPSERQLMTVTFNGLDQPSASVEQLLSAVHAFAAEAAPAAIAAGGGFVLHIRIAPDAANWRDLIGFTLHEENSTGMRVKLRTPQIRRALAFLTSRLDEVAWNC